LTIPILLAISLLYFFIFFIVLRIEKRKNLISRVLRTSYGEKVQKEEGGRLADSILKNFAPIRPCQFYITSFIVLTSIFSLALFFRATLIMASFLSIAVFIIFVNVLRAVVNKGSKKKEKQLEQFLIDLIGNMYANPNILNGIENTLGDIEPPLREDFEKVVDDTRRGILLRDSLNEMVKRNESKLIEVVVTSLLIADEKGVDIISFLKDQIEYIRHRKSLESYIMILSSGPRYTSYIIVSIPVIAIIIILLINREFLSLYMGGSGIILVGYAALSYFIGFFIIHRMTGLGHKGKVPK
jgi:tight adherence protein B